MHPFNYPSTAEEIWDKGLTFIKFVVDTAREPFLLLDKDLKIISANDSFYKFFAASQEESEGKKVYDIGNKQFDIPHLRKLLEDILPKNTFFKDFEVEHDFPIIGKKVILLNARMVYLQGGRIPMIILAMEDVTKRRLLEERMKAYSRGLEDTVMARTTELSERLMELEKTNSYLISGEIKLTELKEAVRQMQLTIKDLQDKLNQSTNPSPAVSE